MAKLKTPAKVSRKASAKNTKTSGARRTQKSKSGVGYAFGRIKRISLFDSPLDQLGNSDPLEVYGY